jgi:hypothetical protein
MFPFHLSSQVIPPNSLREEGITTTIIMNKCPYLLCPILNLHHRSKLTILEKYIFFLTNLNLHVFG